MSDVSTIRDDLKVLWQLAAGPIKGGTHAERLESFYSGQATAYDSFRDRLLHGRRELFAALEFPVGGVWVDFGAGTGANVECLGARLDDLSNVYLVDLCPSLLSVADRRIERHGWTNVCTVLGDATRFCPAEGEADVVTFSYSLTMIPDWFAAIDNALRLLKPSGTIGVVDFYVSRKHPTVGRRRHSWPTRTFWPIWFGLDNVHPTADHLPMLRSRFEMIRLVESAGRIPWLPLLKAPFYQFLGRRG